MAGHRGPGEEGTMNPFTRIGLETAAIIIVLIVVVVLASSLLGAFVR